MKVLVDLNLPPTWVEELRRHGIEAAHWSTIGELGAPDRILFGWAREHDHVILTHDLDFSALLALTRASGPSVIQVRTQDVTPDSISRIVLNVLESHAGALERGAIVTVDAAASRVRILPILP